jgi:ribonuclease HI
VIEVYTDGACKGNPGPGGWAWAVAPEGTPRDSGGELQSTNQRMEIRAVLEAMRSLKGQLVIVSDSTYVVNCINKKWYVNWQRNGWRNSQKQPVANQDLWKPLVDLYDPRLHTFRWVKGHSGNPMNDLVDALAVAASQGPFPATPRLEPAPDPASLF